MTALFNNYKRAAFLEMARFDRWVKASHSIGKIEPFMVPILQGLGRLDCQLMADGEWYRQLASPEQNTIDESVLLSDRITLSYLWILGVYELIRSLDQRCKAKPGILGQDLSGKIKNFRNEIERLRIPLAKFESARKHPADSHIAYPVIDVASGDIAWKLQSNVFVSRTDFSQRLLVLMEEIRDVRQDG